jgi:hypothetical protein
MVGQPHDHPDDDDGRDFQPAPESVNSITVNDKGAIPTTSNKQNAIHAITYCNKPQHLLPIEKAATEVHEISGSYRFPLCGSDTEFAYPFLEQQYDDKQTRLYFPDPVPTNQCKYIASAELNTDSEEQSCHNENSRDELLPLPSCSAFNHSTTLTAQQSMAFAVRSTTQSKRASIFSYASTNLQQYIPHITRTHHEGLKEISDLINDTPITTIMRHFAEQSLEDEFMRKESIKLVHNTIVVSILGIAGVCLVIAQAFNPGSSFFFYAYPTAFTAVGVMTILILVIWKAPKWFLEMYHFTLCAFSVALAGSILMAGWDAVYYKHFNGPNEIFFTYITSRKCHISHRFRK